MNFHSVIPSAHKACFLVLLLFLCAATPLSAAERPPAPFAKDGKYGYRDRQRNVVIAPRFDFAGDFAEGLAPVGVGVYPETKWGFIDLKGKFVIQPQFEAAHPFSEGLAAVKLGGKLGYVDQTGKVIVEPLYDEALPFEGGRARVRILKEGYGYINARGEIIEPLRK